MKKKKVKSWFKKTLFYYSINFDPSKHSFQEDVIRCDIPVIFSCGECSIYDKKFSENFNNEKPNFKVVKNNFLNDSGKSKNPIPYFMLFIKGTCIHQFSSDHENADVFMEENFQKIQNFWAKKNEEESILKRDNLIVGLSNNSNNANSNANANANFQRKNNKHKSNTTFPQSNTSFLQFENLSMIDIKSDKNLSVNNLLEKEIEN